MSSSKIVKSLLAALFLSAGAAQAAPSGADEIPAAWYADQIVVRTSTVAGTAGFPASAYEHGLSIPFAGTPVVRPSIAGGRITPPTSAQETGPKL